jgi:nitrogen fixation protein FixH
MKSENLNTPNTAISSRSRGINWGTSIVIAFVLFASFISYFIIKVQTESKYDNDLVVEEYYKHDAKFGDEMIRKQNAADLEIKPIIHNDAAGISVVFPNQFIPKNIQGKVSLYRPSNKKLDFEIPISLSNSSLLIPKSNLVGGRWDINMEWQYEGKSYLTEETVYIK